MELRATFNSEAERYEAVRPRYPRELFDELIKHTHLVDGAQLLEIGPGTGQATRPLAERGYQITAVELGDKLAEQARKQLAEFAQVRIIHGAFEEVELSEGAFDLVYSATAFHWIKPEYKFTKPHRILKPNGYLAIISTHHVSDQAGDAFFWASKPLYERFNTSDKPTPVKPLQPASEVQPPEKFDEALFEPVSFDKFPLQIKYSAQQYGDLLATYSPHLALPPEKRRAFLDGIQGLINAEFGGSLTKHYIMLLTVGRRKDNG